MENPGDGVKLQDACKVEIVETPYMSPEHAAELEIRRALVPQQWYPITLSPNWEQLLPMKGWLKMVFDDATVVIGQAVGVLPIRMYTGTLLVNGDIADDWVGEVKQPIQAFTDDKEVSEASKNE